MSLFARVVARLRMIPSRAIVFLPFALVAVPVIRLMRRWLLVRWGAIVTNHIGHFALNTELYLCERDHGVNRPRGRYVDLPFLPDLPVSNRQLLDMWKRVIPMYPGPPLEAIDWVNGLIPGGRVHSIGANSNNDRDILDLLAKTPPHVSFTHAEEAAGSRFLESIGLPKGAPFICLNVRDSAYYASIGEDGARQNFRDSDIRNFVLAAEALIDRGFYVLRMGRKVNAPVVSSRRELIDYAYHGMGNELIDLYLGANCYMCLSTGSGFDAIPSLFRRPISLVSFVPVEAPPSSKNYVLYLGKAYVDSSSGKQLTLRQIVERNLVYLASAETYAANGIVLRENSPEEIRDVAIETIERLQGTWLPDPDGERLQKQFRDIMPLSVRDSLGRPLHGQFFIRYSETYLKNNKWWVQ